MSEEGIPQARPTSSRAARTTNVCRLRQVPSRAAESGVRRNCHGYRGRCSGNRMRPPSCAPPDWCHSSEVRRPLRTAAHFPHPSQTPETWSDQPSEYSERAHSSSNMLLAAGRSRSRGDRVNPHRPRRSGGTPGHARHEPRSPSLWCPLSAVVGFVRNSKIKEMGRQDEAEANLSDVPALGPLPTMRCGSGWSYTRLCGSETTAGRAGPRGGPEIQ